MTQEDKDYEDNPLFAIGNDGLSLGRKDGSVKHDDYLYSNNTASLSHSPEYI